MFAGFRGVTQSQDSDALGSAPVGKPLIASIRAWSRRRKVVTSLVAVLVVLALYVGISLGVFIGRHPDDPFQQNVATWARDHQLGFIVNRMERWMHSKPPSSKPAESLALDVSDTVQDLPASTAPSTVPPGNSVPDESTPVTTAAATTTTDPTPAALATPVDPVIEGEGQWRPLVSLGGVPVIWATSVRPLSDYGSVVATAAAIDTERLHAGLFNGPLIPGKRGWNNGSSVMKAAVPSLVATFNGGFRMEHFKGGYITEGRTIRKMRDNEATLAIDRNGRLVLGVWGKDLRDDGTWVSLRQNLPPVVMDGEVSIKKFPGTYWGDDFHNVTFTYRSAVCSLADGRLMYVAVGKVDIELLGKALVSMGCITGMQLDINGNWPSFATYEGFGLAKRTPVLLDKRMGNPRRYLRKSDKDFFAFFDPATLPNGIVE